MLKGILANNRLFYRFISLVLLGSLFLGGVVWFLVSELLGELRRSVGDIVVTDTGIVLRAMGKDAVFLDVPANKFFTRAGLNISKDSVVKIKASGMVSTGGVIDLELVDKDISKKIKDPEWGEEKRRPSLGEFTLQMDREAHYDWRNPDGSHVYNLSGLLSTEKDCLPDLMKKNLLYREHAAEYGQLIAGILPEGEDPSKKHLAERKYEENLFPVGASARIEWSDSQGIYIASYEILGKKHSKQIGTSSGEVFFVINDVIIPTSGEIFTKRTEITGSDECPPIRKDIFSIRKFQENLWEKLGRPPDFYYLNNRGHYSVSVYKEPK